MPPFLPCLFPMKETKGSLTEEKIARMKIRTAQRMPANAPMAGPHSRNVPFGPKSSALWPEDLVFSPRKCILRVCGFG